MAVVAAAFSSVHWPRNFMVHDQSFGSSPGLKRIAWSFRHSERSIMPGARGEAQA